MMKPGYAKNPEKIDVLIGHACLNNGRRGAVGRTSDS